MFTFDIVVEDARQPREPDAALMAASAMRTAAESAAKILALSGVSFQKVSAEINYQGEVEDPAP